MDCWGRTLSTPGLEEYERLLALVDQRRFEEALIRGQVLVEQPQTTALARAKTHNLLCWTFIEGVKRPTPAAVLHGDEAVRLAGRLEDSELQIQALCNLAPACFQVGDYDAADTAYRRVLEMLEAEPSLLSYGRPLALKGLASVDLVRGAPAEALSKLTLAESLCHSGESRALLAEVRRQKALLFVRLNRPQEAAAAVDSLDEPSLADGRRGLWWRVNLGFTRARVEAALYHWANARKLTVNAIALAREMGDKAVLAQCTCLLAQLDAFEGRKEVHRRARAALTYAIDSGRRDVVDEVRHQLKEYLYHEM